MRPVTLDSLKEQIRDRYDLPEYTTSGFVNINSITRLINSALQQYYGLLAESYGDNYFEQTTTITTVTGVNINSFPNRMVKLQSLHWLRGTGDIVPITRATTDAVKLTLDTSLTWSSCDPMYRLQGQSILWLPTPTAIYSVACTYNALPADLVNGSDFFNAGPGHEEYVVSEVCRRIAIREDKDITPFVMERQEVEQAIRRQASQRSETDSLVLRNMNSGMYESDYARRNRLNRL